MLPSSVITLDTLEIFNHGRALSCLFAPGHSAAITVPSSSLQSLHATGCGIARPWSAVKSLRLLHLASSRLITSHLAHPHASAEYDKFIGYATPPTSYGGYGGNANEPPKYTFEYPAGWKQEQPNKVEKGTQVRKVARLPRHARTVPHHADAMSVRIASL